MVFEHLGSLLKGLNLKPLGGIKVLHALARGVHDLAGEPDIDVFKVRRHLKRNCEVLIRRYFEPAEYFRRGGAVNEVLGFERGSHVLEQREARLAAVDFEGRVHEYCACGANEDGLFVKMEFAVEVVVLRFATELAQLREVAVHHDYVGHPFRRRISNKNAAVLVRSVELVFDPDAGVAAFANLPAVVDDGRDVAG
jgi:hypothetical protein